MHAGSGVLIIYTGGTIGMLPKDRNDPSSPLVPASWEELRSVAPALSGLPIAVSLLEMPLIDSSDMHPAYWVDIARIISDHYGAYEGFVVLHGTDTMAYTASALSFLLENLAKPVIVTGSMIPMAREGTDAIRNLENAVKIAAPSVFDLPVIPEVTIVFGSRLLRGNRSTKVGGSLLDGFDSPNYEALAVVGEQVVVNEEYVRAAPTEDFVVHETLDENVMVLDLYPGIRPELLRHIFQMEGMKGIVLRTFGSGNGPTEKEFLAEIRKAIDDDIVVLNVTQCQRGVVRMGVYDGGAALAEIGVVGGADMTVEAALTKLMFLVGRGCAGDELRDALECDLRGELSSA